jgi:thiamine-monophosphate kinase
MREHNFIKSISKNAYPPFNPGIIKAIGDDCAIIEYTKKSVLLFTTDSLVENVHFRRKYFNPWEIGAKAMAVNISDICAMGGIPKFALVNIGFNKKEKQPYIDSIYSGLMHYAKNYGIDIIGGDTVGSRDIFLSITVIGEADKKRVLRRDGAEKGDALFTTGLLGDSYAGLKVLEKKSRDRLKPHEYLPVKKHIVPLPRYMEGRLLALSGCVTACIDLSDGLVNDSLHIAEESKKGVIINAGRIPVSHSASMIAAQFRENPLDYALYGGEDYELLFTVAARKKKKFLKFMAASGVSVFEIGAITGGNGVKIMRNGAARKADQKKIWNHF